MQWTCLEQDYNLMTVFIRLNVAFSHKIMLLEEGKFCRAFNLRLVEDRFELQDCDDQYQNECTCTMLRSACYTSFGVSIVSTCRCIRTWLIHSQKYGRKASTTRFYSRTEILMANGTSNFLNFVSQNRAIKQQTCTRVRAMIVPQIR